MARSGTNTFGLRFGIEASLGVKPTTGWRTLEPNSPSAFGALITTRARRPISPERGRKKGTVVNSESSVEYEGDLTMDAATDFMEGFIFAEWANKEFDFKFALRRAPAHVTVRMGEHNLLQWINTFIFQQTLNGELDNLHVKWLGGKMTAPLPPL